MFKRLLVVFACLAPHFAVAAPKGFPEEFELESLKIRLAWTTEAELGAGYEGTYESGNWFYTLFLEVQPEGARRLWVAGQDAWGNSLYFRYFVVGDKIDGYYLYDEDSGYPFSEVAEPFSDFDFLEPVPSAF